MKTKLAISLLIACALLVATSVWAAPSALDISWHVLGGGGGRVTTGIVALEGTIGQPVAGAVSKSPVNLCSGYWCGAEIFSYRLFLPLVKR